MALVVPDRGKTQAVIAHNKQDVLRHMKRMPDQEFLSLVQTLQSTPFGDPKRLKIIQEMKTWISIREEGVSPQTRALIAQLPKYEAEYNQIFKIIQKLKEQMDHAMQDIAGIEETLTRAQENLLASVSYEIQLPIQSVDSP